MLWFRKKWGKNWSFSTQNYSHLCTGFQDNWPIFRRKMVKMADNFEWNKTVDSRGREVTVRYFIAFSTSNVAHYVDCLHRPDGTDVTILKIFSPKKNCKKLAFLTQNKSKLCKILIITLVFEKNANFFRRKLAKIAENCDDNIDPRFFWKEKEVAHFLASFFTVKVMYLLRPLIGWATLWANFSQYHLVTLVNGWGCVLLRSPWALEPRISGSKLPGAIKTAVA
jgi:hypothetical protein